MESSQKQMLDFWVTWKIDSGYDTAAALSSEFENTFTTRLDDFLYLEIQRKTENDDAVTERITVSKRLSDLDKTLGSLLEEGYIQKEHEKFVLTKKGKKYLQKKIKKMDRRRHKK